MTCRSFSACLVWLILNYHSNFLELAGKKKKKSNFNSGGCFNSIAVFVISIETVRLHQGCPVKGHFEIILFGE
jgi:hypothetical protein